MTTLVQLVEDAARAYGEDRALVMRAGLRDDCWSYARLWRAAGAVAGYLREERGVRPGERVLFCAPNQPRLVAGLIGAMLARAVPVPLDPFSTAGFASRVASDTEAKLFVTDVPLEVPAVTHVGLADLPIDAAPRHELERPEAGDIAEIIYTSGTTGRPKGVVLTHANIRANVLSTDRLIRHDSRWRLLSLLPLSHMLEQTVGLFAQIYRGSTVVYGVTHHPAAIMKALRRYRIVAMVVVPQVLGQMLRALEHEVERRGAAPLWRWKNRIADGLPLAGRRLLWHGLRREMGGALEVFMCGGAHLPVEVAQAWERLGIAVVEGYGATECSPLIAGNTLARRVHGSAGHAVAGVQLRLAPDGEVQVRGASVSSGYWRNDKATRAAFIADGWYRTGDLGELDAASNLRIKGRLKDTVVLPSGLKVFLEDLEEVLKQQPGVRECVALDVRLPSGETGFAAAVIGASAEEVMRGANARLAQHQRLSVLVPWDGDDFPRTNLHKIKRAEVRAWYEGLGRARVAAGGADAKRPEKLVRLLSEVSGVDAARIKPQSNLNMDLALTSLSRVELGLALEERFGVLLDDGELATLETVAQLAVLVEHGPSRRPGATFSAWPLRAPARAARALLQAMLLFPLHALIARPFHVVGREELQRLSLPALLIANHASHVDTVSIIRALPRRIRRRLAVAAAADYFYRFSALGALASLVLNTFPFSRDQAVRASLEHCGQLADEGWSLLVYPEGTRSTSGELLPFKSGIALLAAGLGLPIVPIAVLGGHEVLPKGSVLPRPGAVRVAFGTPLRVRAGSAPTGTVAKLRQAVAELIQTASAARGES